MEGNILITDIATVDGKPYVYTVRYRLISVDGKTQNYVSLPDNFPYHARRMDPKFEMPSCDMSS